MDAEESARAWAASGAMSLTGFADGPPLLGPAGLPGRLEAVTASIADRTAGRVRLDWGTLVTGRAALLGTHRRGRTSPGGSCRLLRAADGAWVAINLPRRDDLASVEALTGNGGAESPWSAVEQWVAATDAGVAVDRAQLLGVPAAVLARPSAAGDPVVVSDCWSPVPGGRGAADLQVVDLSSMWAGPLAARILAAAGAVVTKVESAARPDGARAIPSVYGWLHPPDQPSVTLDFADPEGRRSLRSLLQDADVVIEGSRPRALEQLGCAPGDLADRPGRVWLSITGHGRSGTDRDRVGFGDDAAVAGGLVAWTGDGPVFCADAIADPLTGLVGASAVLDAVAAGGGVLLDAALARTAAWAAAHPGWGAPAPVVAQATPAGGWTLPLSAGAVPVAEPRLPGRW